MPNAFIAFYNTEKPIVLVSMGGRRASKISSETILGIIEFIVAVVIIVALFLSFIYFSSSFFEARMSSVMTGLKLLALFVTLTSFLIPFAGRSNYLFISVLLNGILWLNLFARNFPFTRFFSIHTIAPFVMAFVTHTCMTIEMINGWDCGLFLTLSYIILFVWAVPIIALATTCSLDDETEYGIQKGNLGLGNTLKKFISWLRRLLKLGMKKQ